MSEFPSQAELIKKYDVPTPRYTSYPTVPYWNEDEFSIEKWIRAVRTTFLESNEAKGISLYLHLPFCENLCTYCACNKRITKNHSVEIAYIRSLLKEWNHYIAIFGRKPVIRELHLGGGTPTFFSPENLKWLVSYVLEEGLLHDENEFSFEGHPNNTSAEHLQTLFDLGFRRVSFGVQDLDPKVQQTINRVQPFQNLQQVTRLSQAIGYNCISFDLIYGLPHQTVVTIGNTVRKVLELRPNRLSFYSYAHVPWVSPGQRGYSETDLPSDIQKRELYERGRTLLRENGYMDIGMDHFSLTNDSLYHARQNRTLHRNFMGYTTTETDLLIGLGASAISDAKYAYAQNLKKVETYSQTISEARLAVFKGHIMSEEDLQIKENILNVTCHGEIRMDAYEALDPEARKTLRTMCREGILTQHRDRFSVTELGHAFVRNICAVFDKKLRLRTPSVDNLMFSKSI